MPATRLLVFLFFSVEYVSIVLGLKCFECVDVPNPFQCDIVTTCPGGYKCFVDQKITSGGMILYDIGCRSPNICRTRKRQTNVESIEQETESDIVTCEDCCDGDFCNRAGCGVPVAQWIRQCGCSPDGSLTWSVYITDTRRRWPPNPNGFPRVGSEPAGATDCDLDRSIRGPYCFTCHIQGGKDLCRHVSQCLQGELCSIKDTSVNTVTQYRTECLLSTECHQNTSARGARATSVDKCSSCCDADFCNNDCIPPPVDGGFTTWSAWTACTVTCGGGHQQRSRTCTNPSPSHGGAICAGDTTDSRSCGTAHCPVDGAFTTWSAWGTCTVTCGGGHQQRSRTCTNPVPSHGGAICAGDTTDSRSCGTAHCPVDGAFTNWSAWGTCTVTCGGGHQQRSRSCTHPAPSHGGAICAGDTTDSRSCGTMHCPVNGGFTTWTAWTTCTFTCGGGHQQRSRACTNPAPSHGGAICAGNMTDSRSCGTAHCPVLVNGGFTTWGVWTACTRSCGGGHQQRSRSCTNPAPANGGAQCVGSKTSSRGCGAPHCPVNGGFTGWSAWTQCSVTCGGGQQHRSRSCLKPAPAHGGLDCVGDKIEDKQCDTAHCPVDGGLTAWSDWHACSVTCGKGGNMWRRRTCTNPRQQFGGARCVGDKLEYQPCPSNIAVQCPVDGGVTLWSRWTSCSKTCGGQGQQTRIRSCTHPRPAHGGKQCTEPLQEIYNCTSSDQCIPADGYGPWGQWSACARTCGNHAVQTRRRTCLISNSPLESSSLTSDRRCYGKYQDMKRCGSLYCPVNGGFTAWSAWSTCSVTCGVGHGVNIRYRNCTHPAPSHGGAACVGGDVDKQGCTGNQKCPTTHVYNVWSAWTSCSEPCGMKGVRHRTKHCSGSTHCPPVQNQTEECNRWICRSDCVQGSGFRYFPPAHMCLRVLNHEMDWYHARRECAREHSDLVMIDSRLKDQVVHQLLMNTPHTEHGVWIGLEGYAQYWRWKHHWVILNAHRMYNNFLQRSDLVRSPYQHCGSLQLATGYSQLSNSSSTDEVHHLPYGWLSRPCTETRIAVCERFPDLF